MKTPLSAGQPATHLATVTRWFSLRRPPLAGSTHSLGKLRDLTNCYGRYILNRIYKSRVQFRFRNCPRTSLNSIFAAPVTAPLNFRRTARAVTRLYDSLAFQGTGIRSTQFTILIGVAKTQPTSISALGSMLVIDSTTLTRSLAKLQKQGLLTISKRGTRRQRFVTLTPEGEKSLADSLPGWRVAQERFVKAIGADFWLGFRSELERLAHLAVSLEAPGGEAAQVTPSPSA